MVDCKCCDADIVRVIDSSWLNGRADHAKTGRRHHSFAMMRNAVGGINAIGRVQSLGDFRDAFGAGHR